MIDPARGTRVEVFRDDLDRWRSCHEALPESSHPMALEHRSNWIRDVTDGSHWFVAVRGGSGREVRAAAVARRISTRSLPGHHRLRLTRFGHGVGSADVATVLEAFRDLVDREGRLLSVNVEAFTPSGDHRASIGRIARELGFEHVIAQRSYRWTARLDLSADEDSLFAGLSRSGRRGVREPEKHGFRIGDVVDPRYIPRMAALWLETFDRTGGRPPPRDWARRIAFARARPDLYRVVGAFAPDVAGSQGLVAFACGRHNGNHATYSDGASTREIDSRVSLSYAPVWRLICWAREQGCGWFDMGGVSDPSRTDGDDPREGITDFKRRFTDEFVEVGSEWSYTPDSLRSRLAEWFGRSGKAIRGLRDSLNDSSKTVAV